MMIIFVDGLFAVPFKCSQGFDSWCCPGIGLVHHCLFK